MNFGRIEYVSGYEPKGVPKGMPFREATWEQLSDVYGVQMSAPVAEEEARDRAKHRKLSMAAIERVRVHCQECGKQETPRDRCIVTRSSLVCVRCYEPSEHGQPSTTEYPPPDEKRRGRCLHPYHRCGIRFNEYDRQITYCMDCGKDVNYELRKSF